MGCPPLIGREGGGIGLIDPLESQEGQSPEGREWGDPPKRESFFHPEALANTGSWIFGL